MDKDVKQGIESGIGAATTIAFAIPGMSPVIAGFLAGSGFLFDLCADLGDAKDGPQAPRDEHHVTTEQLNTVMGKLATTVKDQNIIGHYNSVSTSYDSLRLDWPNAHNIKPQERREFLKNLGLLESWDSLGTDVFKRLLETSPPVKELIHTSMTGGRPIHTFPLFIYGVNAFLLMGKMATMWEYLAILRRHEKAVADGHLKEKDLEALQKAIENGEIDLDAKDDTAAAADAPDALKSVITKLQFVATIRNASVYVAEVHKYLAGQPGNPGYVKHLRDMIKRLDDYYDAAANKMDEFRSGFLRADSNGSKFILTTPISDGQLISVAYGPSRSEDIVTNFILGRYLPGVWADMIDERDVDGAGAPLSSYGPMCATNCAKS
ncbi:MAG: hypothetical protein QNK92_08885 [Amylibacter sp.]